MLEYGANCVTVVVSDFFFWFAPVPTTYAAFTSQFVGNVGVRAPPPPPISLSCSSSSSSTHTLEHTPSTTHRTHQRQRQCHPPTPPRPFQDAPSCQCGGRRISPCACSDTEVVLLPSFIRTHQFVCEAWCVGVRHGAVNVNAVGKWILRNVSHFVSLFVHLYLTYYVVFPFTFMRAGCVLVTFSLGRLVEGRCLLFTWIVAWNVAQKCCVVGAGAGK